MYKKSIQKLELVHQLLLEIKNVLHFLQEFTHLHVSFKSNPNCSLIELNSRIVSSLSFQNHPWRLAYASSDTISDEHHK
ncbi:hypothetical protein Sjap_022261 [Stephania japonica]|uniref:Uncharacterized protein n=1 Tax=Stephania japonica TaxID=461633 RepID=A0AAP0HSN1_9MAGN